MKKIMLECKRHNVHFTVNNLPNFREQQKTAHAAGIWAGGKISYLHNIVQ